jgi:4-diphosphocytidyl-2-C-methyl-D-erythritol kinase
MGGDSITLAAPAKINLFLKILGKRADGYHDIYSLVQAISLYDTLTLTEIDHGIELTGDRGLVPLDSSNIVWMAVELLRQETGFASGVRIDLIKRIPVGAGLGGGSSDAAATLNGVNRLLNLKLAHLDLQHLGARLGSDVPFFFSSGSALISGRGEIVEDVNIAVDYQVLLVVPDFAVSTAEAYSQIRFFLTDFAARPTFTHATLSAELFVLLSKIGNDFEGPVTHSHRTVSSCMKIIREAGARLVVLSGSGSAFFGLFDRAPDPLLETMITGRFGWQVYRLSPVKLEWS